MEKGIAEIPAIMMTSPVTSGGNKNLSLLMICDIATWKIPLIVVIADMSPRPPMAYAAVEGGIKNNAANEGHKKPEPRYRPFNDWSIVPMPTTKMVIERKNAASELSIPIDLMRIRGKIKEVAMRRACCTPRRKHGTGGGISSTVYVSSYDGFLVMIFLSFSHPV